MKLNWKKLFKTGLLLIIFVLLFIIFANLTIKKQSASYLFDDIKKIPQVKTALVLGTSKTLNNGIPNDYFDNRIKATSTLFNSGKINYIIVSGDNSQKNYNEPQDMKLALMEAGIPENRIYEDFAGFRTLDSVIRAKEIFGQSKIIIVSQKFHNERAVYLARKNNIEAYAYNAEDVNKYAGLRTNIREYIAKAKVFWDMIFDIQPKFGGKKIIIPE